MRYALAKEYEDIGEYAKSFRQLQQGATERRRHMRYDVGVDVATVDWIIDAFPAVPTPTLHGAGEPAAAAPIFIVGLPRSGTTLVDRILGSHPAIFSAGELNHFALCIVDAVRRGGAPQLPRRELIARSAELDFAALGRDYLDKVRRAGVDAVRFTDKMPLNYLYCGLIQRALPNAKIVHVTRQPMAACYSMYKTLFKDGYPFSYDLGEIARYFIGYRRLMEHWQAAAPGRIYPLSYEALVADQLGETRKLLEFCGLEWQDACVEFHRNPMPTTTASASQVRRRMYDSSVSQWRHYAAELKELSAALRNAGIDVEPMTDPAARIERHTIYPIPAAERHGRARDLFTVWFGSNIMVLTIVTGALATVRFQLSLLRGDFSAILIGNLVGGVFMALHAAQGPQLGVPQMVQSRGQFGSVGAIFVVALVVVMYIGFVASNLVLGGQSLHSIAGWHQRSGRHRADCAAERGGCRVRS